LELKWSDIDLKKGIIHVQRQILRQNGKVIEAPLKTKNSYRNIAIGADAIKVFRGIDPTSKYVFPSPHGGPMSPDSVLHILQRVLKQARLERIRFHDLRDLNVKHKSKIINPGLAPKILSGIIRKNLREESLHV